MFQQKKKQMKHQISTSIIIQSDLETVWNIFTDFKSYPDWNPFIKSLTGEITVDKKFNVELSGMKFSPIALIFKEQQEFTWLGKLVFPGIFDGRHSFTFEQLENGKVKMTQKEDFSGILVRLLKKKLDFEVKQGFMAMNEKLKELSEAQSNFNN